MAILNEIVHIGTVECQHTWSSAGFKIRKTGTDKELSEAVDVIDPDNPEYPVYEEVGAYTDAQAQDAAQVVSAVFGGLITPERATEIKAEITGDQTDAQAAKTPELYPAWSDTGTYTQDERIRYNGVLYKCLQGHTAQAAWTPEAAASLWAKVLVEKDTSGNQTSISDWQQPDSTNPYAKGDKVRFNGKVYESNIDGNVWSPSAYPAGWKEVSA